MRECVEKLFVSVSYLFSSLVNILTEADSLQLSYGSDGDEYRDTDRRDQTRDDFSHCSTSKSECVDELLSLSSPEYRSRDRLPSQFLLLPESNILHHVMYSHPW